LEDKELIKGEVTGDIGSSTLSGVGLLFFYYSSVYLFEV